MESDHELLQARRILLLLTREYFASQEMWDAWENSDTESYNRARMTWIALGIQVRQAFRNIGHEHSIEWDFEISDMMQRIGRALDHLGVYIVHYPDVIEDQLSKYRVLK